MLFELGKNFALHFQPFGDGFHDEPRIAHRGQLVDRKQPSVRLSGSRRVEAAFVDEPREIRGDALNGLCDRSGIEIEQGDPVSGERGHLGDARTHRARADDADDRGSLQYVRHASGSSQTRSIAIAMPWPTPMHIVQSAKRALRRSSS
ncbi:hypothetical protein OKW34_004526 [Paraburkholderia youngii]